MSLPEVTTSLIFALLVILVLYINVKLYLASVTTMLLLLRILCKLPINKKSKKRLFSYNRADWDSFREEVTEITRYYFDLNEHEHRLVEENWNFIRVNLTRALETHIPVRFISSCKHVLG